MDMILLQRVINERIRPYLEGHGGSLEVLSCVDGIVEVRLHGNCSGCPSAYITTEQIIKKEIMDHIPEVKDVVLDTGVPEDLLAFAKQLINQNKDSDSGCSQ